MATSVAFPRWTFNLIWLPVAVFALSEIVLATLAKHPDYMPASREWFTWDEAAARLQFLALTILFFVFSLGVFAKFLFDQYVLFDKAGREQLWKVFVLLLAIAAAVIIPIEKEWLPGTKQLLSANVLDAGLQASLLKGTDRFWSPALFEALRIVTSVVTALAVASFITTGISCVARFTAINECENWALQWDRLKTCIYFSAGLLVVGVLYLKAWTQYPSFILPDPDRLRYIALVNSYAMFFGVEFSIMLCAYALPVAIYLSHQADHIAARIAGIPPTAVIFNAQVQQTRVANNLVFSQRDIFQTLVALLAPFITGSVASLSAIFGS